MNPVYLFLVCALAPLAVEAQVQEFLLSDTTAVIRSTDVQTGDERFKIQHDLVNRGTGIIYYDSARQHKAYSITYAEDRSYVSTQWYTNGQVSCIQALHHPLSGNSSLEFQSWYPDGKVKSIRVCNADSCVSAYYYNDGQLKLKNIELWDTTIQRKVWHYTAEYYENGQLKYTPYDPNGDQVIVHYYSSGAKQCQLNRSKGQMYGKWLAWYENGNLKVSGEYKKTAPDEMHLLPKPIGLWIYYDETGKKTKKEWYEDGKLVKERNYK